MISSVFRRPLFYSTAFEKSQPKILNGLRDIEQLHACESNDSAAGLMCLPQLNRSLLLAKRHGLYVPFKLRFLSDVLHCAQLRLWRFVGSTRHHIGKQHANCPMRSRPGW